MIESASRRFLELLEVHRNELYALAVQGGTPAVIETALQRGIRSAFREYARNEAPREGQVEWLAGHIQAELGNRPAAAPVTISDVAMPADVWARLAAAIQIEAATLGGADEQSMLAYDPLLAPQKKNTGSDEAMEGLNLSPWTRFVIATAIVLFIGIVATIILTTHHAPATTQVGGPRHTVPASPSGIHAKSLPEPHP
ncbi:MAG: hypothetical protein ACP5VQ_07495 [Phycisphaerae bacterium]